MGTLTTIFWNTEERRVRAFFRILLFVLLAALFAALIALVINDFNPFFEKTFTNFFVMLAILLSIYLAGTFLDKRKWADFGITLLPLKSFLHGAMLGALLIIVIFFIQYGLAWVSLK